MVLFLCGEVTSWMEKPGPKTFLEWWNGWDENGAAPVLFVLLPCVPIVLQHTKCPVKKARNSLLDFIGQVEQERGKGVPVSTYIQTHTHTHTCAHRCCSRKFYLISVIKSI